MKQINMRLPDELHARLKDAAEDDRRSINTMVILLIEEGLKRRSGEPVS